ncbi:MAG: garA [Myxococcales bacterium]|nr:garA [Myxococcales bacterium]
MARLPPGLRGKPLDWGDDEAATRVQGDAASLALVARDGPMAGSVFGTNGDVITIGRGSSCAIRLALSEISRRHAVVRYRAGRYWVEDLQTLNGTRVNEQLIDGLTALKQGDRIRIGVQTFEVRFDVRANRQMVYDGPASEALSVSTPQRTNRGPFGAPLGPIGLGAVALLAISTGTLLAFAITRQSHRTAEKAHAAHPSARAASDTTRPAPGVIPASPASAATAPPEATVRARVEVDGAVALAARDGGSVQWAAARGTPVRKGDELVRIRRNNTAKQRELERVNEQLEDDDSNPQLIRRAHAIADELSSEPGTATIKSDFDGVVVSSLAPGMLLHARADELRVAHRVRLIVDPSAIGGGGSACRVVFIDQRLEAEGRRVVGTVGATIELTRFSAKLSFEHVGRVRADCT